MCIEESQIYCESSSVRSPPFASCNFCGLTVKESKITKIGSSGLSTVIYICVGCLGKVSEYHSEKFK